ncbi:MAG: peptidase MA family metallohydrolase [Candidatus Omnitrophota bacterium]
MKRFLLNMVFIVLANSPAFAAERPWQEAKSTHFIVNYKNAPEDFINRSIEKLESCYERITEKLGFRRYNFWLWDKRAVVYIHDDAGGFHAATGQPSWVSGEARPQEKTIHTFTNASGFFESLLPHEMAHIIFREFVGFYNRAVPVCLDEGVASYQEASRVASAAPVIREALRANALIRLETLVQLNPQLMNDQDSVRLFYAESVSLVDYLIRTFGQDKFVSFCQALRDKQDLCRALASTYSFASVTALGDAWMRSFTGSN